MFQKVTEPWSRQEHFDHYLNHVRCSYSFTVEIEVTELHAKLKALGLKTYPVHIYLLAAAVNQLPEFRMGLVDGAPARKRGQSYAGILTLRRASPRSANC